MSSESHSRPPVPDLLHAFDWAERFELLDCIGSGAMGQVWRARERDSAKIVALKMLDPTRVGDEQTLARLDIEAATLMKLREAGSHANVVPILDFKLTESRACLVMEFIPGLNLKKWCEAHRLGLRERVRFIAQVAHASGWFHALGVVHRDLKPANILVNAVTQQPIIVDFSIAKLEDSLPLTLTNEALGTAPYMAPEQIDRSRGGIAPATDVYALAATLYELLTQVHPHPGDLTQVVRRHADEIRPAPPSVLNPEVPRDLECIVLKALSHRPGDRYADGTAMAEDLERYLAGEQVKARSLSLATRVIRRARQKPALTAALAACLLLGAFALWNVQRQAAQRARFALETKLTSAMQHGTWSAAALAQAESTLVTLNEHDPALAVEMRQRLHDDIVRDLNARIGQSHLRDADFVWLRETTEWLRPQASDQAAQLQSLITERIGRWETKAELRAPFADHQGLFPSSDVRADGDLLYPVYDAPAFSPAIIVTKSVSVPMEVACTFVAKGNSFHHIAVDLTHGASRVTLALYKALHAPRGVIHSFGDERPDPQNYVLFISHNQTFRQALHIPDPHLLDQPFRLTLRLERDQVEADVNGQWRLNMDSPFALGSVQATNGCRISWPKDIGLQALMLRTRRADVTSPLERADLLAAQEQWAAARRLYDDLQGDPLYGAEASYKIAECLRWQNDHGAALTVWERLLQGPHSPWRDRSIIQLWVRSAMLRSADAARYLALLPDPLPPAMLQQIDPWTHAELQKSYVPVGLGIALPKLDAAEVTAAARTYRLLRMPPVQTANRFAMAHHMARLEQEADSIYRHALADPMGSATTAANLTAALNCLDQWCRITPSEKNTELAESHARWQKALPKDQTVQAIWHMEQARRAARADDLKTALAAARTSRSHSKADNRVLTSAWLLEGLIHRMLQREDKAQQAWSKALEVASTVTMKHPLHLCDSILLHSLTQSWDLRSVGDVLTTLVGKHLKDAERTTAQAAFNQTFLSDPAWLTTFNAVLQDERGRTFAEDYVLCRAPPRELFPRFYRLLFEHYFLTTAFPQPPLEHTSRVRQIVDTLVTEMTTNPRGEIEHLYAYLHAWNDHAAAQTLFHKAYPYSPELIENMKWLLSMRHRQVIVKAGR